MNNQKLKEEYEAGESVRDLCKKYNSYPSKIHSILKSVGAKIRTKSEAQSLNIATGKVPHPTEGKERSHKTKLKISKKLHQQWIEMSEEDKLHRSEVSKEHWENRSETEKKEFRDQGYQAIREAAEKGSKMEHFLVDEINNAGFTALHHKNRMLPNINLEVDILVSDLKVVIEADGPSHQKPIWGEDSFEKRLKSDLEKNGLLLSAGYVVIRCKFNDSKMSMFKKNEGKNKLINTLQAIKTKFPKQEDRYIEIVF